MNDWPGDDTAAREWLAASPEERKRLNLGRPLMIDVSDYPELVQTGTLIIDVRQFPGFGGQQLGRELELEMTAIVTRLENNEGGIPSERVVLTIVRADITQTT